MSDSGAIPGPDGDARAGSPAAGEVVEEGSLGRLQGRPPVELGDGVVPEAVEANVEQPVHLVPLLHSRPAVSPAASGTSR